MNKERIHTNAAPGKSSRKSVKHILLKGVFWRILVIEGVLLVWSVFYMLITEDADGMDLLWYTLRIVLLVGIIILFMMVSLKSFLTRKVITSLENIALANRRLLDDDPAAREVVLPTDAPEEIRQIAESRKQMLDTIFKVSEERLHLMNFIKDTFGRYLSKKVVEEILASPEGQKIGGQRKTVTILMSDLRGFTYMSETNDPERIVSLLNRYLERMSKVIVSYGGIIDEFIGDAILAVFGVPEEHDDDPTRAVACGIAMQNALDALNEEFAREGHPPLEMGIGINTGQVVVGNIGSEVRTKYGVVGRAVNVAARIESNTTGGEVFVGESTYTEIRSRAVTEKPHTAMMKGLKSPLVYYPVKAVNAPYHVKLRKTAVDEDSASINLPFHYWVIEDERVGDEGMSGKTLKINENTIEAVVDRPLRRRTDVKMKFDFCSEAHCFDEIYAKVKSTETSNGNAVSQFIITSINPKDRDILRRWVLAAS
ncbi:MAG: adenylate/guanylate cyclase domain-containing protein [Deltaproteobacteria bacterium]|nr:adenylate/guanylate cyclase domain-containing protein [Deltaproteobacteria bacterium]MBW2676363.1 adenylate/guanylate cyclase domain-containing protein [Deltaproteobacteria bacterium]